MNAQTVPAVIETSIAEYSQTAAALADLNQRYRGVVYDVTTTKGMDAAKRGRQEIRGYRTSLENKRKEIKAPALDLCRRIDSEAQRITAALVELEDPIDATIKAEETKKEAERQARIEAERVRIATLQDKVAQIANYPAQFVGSLSIFIFDAISALRSQNPRESEFAEFLGQAIEAKQKAIETLGVMMETQKAHEVEQDRIKAEREELTRLRAEQDRRDKEQREREAVERQKIEAERRAAAEMIAEGQRKAKAQQDELDRQAQALRDEQDRVARVAREKDAAELAAKRAEIEAAEKVRREAELAERAKVEAAERAARAEANEKMAAEEMLKTFLKKYGARKEFEYIVFAINQYFD